MDASELASKMAEYESMIAGLDRLRSGMKTAIQAATPLEVRVAIGDIEDEFNPAILAATAACDAAKALLVNAGRELVRDAEKEDAKALLKPLDTDLFTLQVYGGGKGEWDDAELRGFASGLEPRLKKAMLALRRETKPDIRLMPKKAK